MKPNRGAQWRVRRRVGNCRQESVVLTVAMTDFPQESVVLTVAMTDFPQESVVAPVAMTGLPQESVVLSVAMTGFPQESVVLSVAMTDFPQETQGVVEALDCREESSEESSGATGIRSRENRLRR